MPKRNAQKANGRDNRPSRQPDIATVNISMINGKRTKYTTGQTQRDK